MTDGLQPLPPDVLISVQPPSGVNVRDGVWGRIIGTTNGQQFRVEGWELEAGNGRLWLVVWWEPGNVYAYVAGWLCTLSMLSAR